MEHGECGKGNAMKDNPLVVTVLFGVNAVIWFVNVFRWEENGLAVAAMLMWLAGTMIWGRRAWKERGSE